MTASTPEPFDAAAVLSQLTEPDLWRLLARFPPPAARRSFMAASAAGYSSAQ